MKSEKGNVCAYITIAITVIILIAIISVIIGSIKNDIDYGTKQGTIVDKRYSSPYTSYTTSNARNSTIQIPRYYPETYRIKLQKRDGSKTKECWIEVPAQEYEKYNIGDYYN